MEMWKKKDKKKRKFIENMALVLWQIAVRKYVGAKIGLYRPSNMIMSGVSFFFSYELFNFFCEFLWI